MFAILHRLNDETAGSSSQFVDRSTSWRDQRSSFKLCVLRFLLDLLDLLIAHLLLVRFTRDGYITKGYLLRCSLPSLYTIGSSTFVEVNKLSEQNGRSLIV